MKAVGLSRYLPIDHPESLLDLDVPAPAATLFHTKELAPQLAALGTPEVDDVFCLSNIEPYVPAFPAIIAPQGKICAIVGPSKPLDLGPLMAKSVTFAWELMFTRPAFQTRDMIVQHEILDEAADVLEGF